MTSDCPLDYMLLDDNGMIIVMDFKGSEKYSKDIEPSFSLKFYHSLHRGDRTLLTEFCKTPFEPTDPQFNIYHIVNFCGYSYLFVEKAMYDGKTVNIALFGNTIYDFKPLISPDTAHYGTAVGRIIYDIINTTAAIEPEKLPTHSISPLERDGYLVRTLIKPVPTIENYLTPEALVHISKAPQLVDELRRKTSSTQNCDAYLYTKTIVKHIEDASFCENTSIEIISDEDQQEKRIFPIKAVPYVHVIISLVHILSNLSRDNKISIKLNYYESGATATLSTVTFPRYKFISDTTSFTELAAANKLITYTAAALTVLAEELGFTPLIRFDKDKKLLSVSVKITESYEGKVDFRYNDPYLKIADVFAEVLEFLDLSRQKHESKE